MALTKKQTQCLNDILGKLKKSERYILDPSTKIWSEKFNCFITKEYGSEISYLYRAIESLELFLKPELETMNQ